MKLSKIHTLLTVAALTTFSTQALAALSGTLVLKGKCSCGVGNYGDI